MMVVVVALGRIVTMMRRRRRRRRTWRWWCCDADTMMIPDRREAAIYSSWCFASVGETSMQVCFIQVLSQNIYHAIIIYWFHLILVVNPCTLPLASCRGRNPSSSPRKHQRTIRIKYLKIQVFEAFGHGSSLTALITQCPWRKVLNTEALKSETPRNSIGRRLGRTWRISWRYLLSLKHF